MTHRQQTHSVKVGNVTVGGGAPIVIQSMTNTDTADVASTVQQCLELASAGSEMVRITVNLPEAAAAVPEIKQRMLDAGCEAPLIGDFHYNGHVLLTKYPDCARALDKYRINPGNVGAGKRRDEQFATICSIARDNGKPVRIGVNGGSLNQELVMRKMQENTDRELGLSSEEIINECMVLSAVESTELALQCGLREDQIIISCKVSRPLHLIAVYRTLAQRTRAALASRPHRSRHGPQGRDLVFRGHGYSAQRRHRRHHSHLAHASRRMAIAAKRSTPHANCSRRSAFAPFFPASPLAPAADAPPARPFSSSPKKSRATSARKCPSGSCNTKAWNEMTLAVMGCIVNGPGESQAANIGISLPGTGESPSCPVYIDGQHFSTLRGTYDDLSVQFQALVDDYIANKYARREAAPASAGAGISL